MVARFRSARSAQWVLVVFAALATFGVGHASAASPPSPLSTVRALEGEGDVTIARLVSIARTKRLGWEPTAGKGAAYTGVALDEVVAALEIEGDAGDRSDAIGVLERLASPDPELHRPPLVGLTAPGGELRGVVESLSYECAGERCDVRLVLLQTDAPSVAPEGGGATETTGRDAKSAPASASDKRVGYLTLDTYPWTRVLEDGRAIGTTPLVHVPLAPGVHKLTLENRLLGIRQAYTVTVESGVPVARRLGLR